MFNKRLINLLGESKKYIGLTVFINWISLLANVVSIFSVARLLEAVLNKTASKELVVTTLLIVMAVISVRIITSLLSSRTSFMAASQVKKFLRENIYRKLLDLGASYNDKVSTSEVVQVSVEGVEQLEIYFGQYLPQLFYSLLAPLTLFAILSFVNVKSALVLLFCVPLIPISIVAVQKIAKKLLNKYWGTYTQMGDSFLENIQGLTTLKIYQADEKKSQQMDVEAENFRIITMKVLTMQLNSITIMDLVAFGGAALGVIVSVSEFLKGNISFAGTFAIIMLSSEFFIPLRLLGSFFHIAMNGMAASEKIFKILDLEANELEGDELKPGDIVFENMSFAYDDRDVLSEVNLDIKEGNFVSFVGESGSGKSTIASLLMGNHPGFRGQIKVSGQDIRSLAERSLMRNITMVSHHSYLFKGTVRDNLLMGDPSASDARLEEVLKKVNLYGFLQGEAGLDTELLERGSNFSGGQAQRLAMARALLHDSPIYIFDEATSNIDVESEERIMDLIRELAETKTIILISHRLANVLTSDKIFVLDRGRLVEKGSHQELMAKNGAYASLYINQEELENYGKRRREPSYA